MTHTPHAHIDTLNDTYANARHALMQAGHIAVAASDINGLVRVQRNIEALDDAWVRDFNVVRMLGTLPAHAPFDELDDAHTQQERPDAVCVGHSGGW